MLLADLHDDLQGITWKQPEQAPFFTGTTVMPLRFRRIRSYTFRTRFSTRMAIRFRSSI